MIPAFALGGGYLILFGITTSRRTRRNPAEGRLIVFCIYSILLMLVHGVLRGDLLMLPAAFPVYLILLIVFMISVGLVVQLTLSYLAMERRPLLIAGILTGLWFVANLVLYGTRVPSILGPQPWLIDAFGGSVPITTEIAGLGWLLIVLVLLVLNWRAFLIEPLPMYANRILFWVAVSPLLLLGDVLSIWPQSPWYYVGYGLRFVGAVGAVYAVVQSRVIDLREAARWVVSRTIITLVIGGLVLGGILVPAYVDIPGLRPELEPWIIAGAAALIVAFLITPINRFMRWLLRNLISRSATNPTEAVRRYSQRVNVVIDLAELADVASDTINELLGTRRSLLILTTKGDEGITLQPAGTDLPEGLTVESIALDSPIYQTIIENRRPLLQYDIDYDKRFVNVPEAERQYFSRLNMDIYAPIVNDGALLGLLALGPKLNDDPFRNKEIELLEALANQTVVALENARLVTDLRELNERMSVLNEDLTTTNERLEKIDAVKSDFLVIASHELRTPLTQIQGYTDLLAEMAQRNMLDPDETTEITTSLAKASRRMTEVIGSMLDVTQIDVESMDLNFVETTLSNILKLAIEPYGEAIQQRQQTLVARGLRNLPPIYGDYKRLVQAFQNVITNAIKYTPDGGKIEVLGQIWERDDAGEPVNVRVTISDNGIGVDPANHDLIFEKFYRVGPVGLHSTGETKFKGAGPGLGLPIARGIIERHGGRIWVESEAHDEDSYPGATFHIMLPIKPPAIDAQKRLREIQEAKGKTDIAGMPLVREEDTEELVD